MCQLLYTFNYSVDDNEQNNFDSIIKGESNHTEM